MTGGRTRSTFDLVDSRRSVANWRIDGAGMGRLPAQRARPRFARRRLDLAQDVFGNDVATVTFSAMTDVLAIDAAAELELHASAWPVFDISLSILG